MSTTKLENQISTRTSAEVRFFVVGVLVFTIISCLYLVFMNNVDPQSIPQWLANYPQPAGGMVIALVGIMIVASALLSKSEWGRNRLKTFYFGLVIPLAVGIGLIPIIFANWGIKGLVIYLIVLGSVMGIGLIIILVHLVLFMFGKKSEPQTDTSG